MNCSPTDIDIVIDASSLYARAFFAAQRSGTDPVIAGLRSFLGVINHTKATRAILCWDGKSKSEKVREEKPEGYDDHRASFKEHIDWLWACPQIRSMDHEADDLVASVVYSDLVSQEIYVVSGDKDLQQLMDCRKDRTVGYYCLNKKKILDTDEVVLESGPQKLNWRHPSELDDANLNEIREQYSTGYYNAAPVSIDDI